MKQWFLKHKENSMICLTSLATYMHDETEIHSRACIPQFMKTTGLFELETFDEIYEPKIKDEPTGNLEGSISIFSSPPLRSD